MKASPPPERSRARILGPRAIVVLEDPRAGSRGKVRILARSDRLLEVESLTGSDAPFPWAAGTGLQLRAARPFGLFCYWAIVAEAGGEGRGVLKLDPSCPKRRQMRGYFRMPVRLAALVETRSRSVTTPMLRASNLSGSGILLDDPGGLLAPGARVRLGLPIAPSGELMRLSARVVRMQASPRRAALTFDRITEGERLIVLRYLFREYCRRRKRRRFPRIDGARITPIKRT
ncbi:MAG: PilZ domain-containing protein [Candidatus Eisenbacteria bacterium]|nr:PilZ domain-containing protein [Candidatus Eisenbacteria bacterium]